MKFYRPQIDRLETRQMMASDVDLNLPVSQEINSNSGDKAFAQQSAAGFQTTSEQSDSSEFILSNPIIDYLSDSVVVRTGSTVVIGSRLNSEVLILEGADSETPKIHFRLPLDGLGIQDIKADGNRAIVVGQTSDNHTQVIAIDLTAGKIVNRAQFPPGSFGFAHLSGNDAWVVLCLSTKPIFSPSGDITYQDDSRLIHLQWGEAGLVEQASLQVDEGLWSVANNRLMMAASTFPVHNITLHLYDIGEGHLAEMASLELKSSYAKSIFMSTDGQRASLIRGVGDPSFVASSSVDLLDLSNGSIRITQSVAIDDFADVYRHDSDLALLYGQEKQQLITVDLRSSTASQSRTQRWDVPYGYNTSPGPIQLSNGRIGVTAYAFDFGPFFSSTEVPSETPKDGTYLLILDPQSSQLKTVPIETARGKFISLEPGTDRIGIWGWSRVEAEVPTFTFGKLDDDLKFVNQVAIPTVYTPYDLPLIYSNRLLTAGSDQVAIYDLENAGKPLLAEYVAEHNVPLKAVSLDLQISKQEINFDLFSLYLELFGDVTRLHLVALEGAPSDIKILDRLTIGFAENKESNREPVDFDYIISDGVTQARGHIHGVYTDDGFFSLNISSANSIPNPTSKSPISIEAPLMLKHNPNAPLDVNQDGMVSLVDAVVVINEYNQAHFKSSEFAIDTSGNGSLELLDALLIINFLNANSRPLMPDLVSNSEETIDQIQVAALKEHLARISAQNRLTESNLTESSLPWDQLLVGFQPPVGPLPVNPDGSSLSYVETVNQSIQSLVPLTSATLSQAGLREYSLGSSKLAVWKDGPVVNRTTMEAVNLLRVGRPRAEEDGTVRLELVSNFGTPDGSSGFEYQLQIVAGKWQVVSGGMIWIS